MVDITLTGVSYTLKYTWNLQCHDVIKLNKGTRSEAWCNEQILN